MTVRNNIEIEVKFRIGDTGPVERRLKGLGAKLVKSGLEKNIKFRGNGLEKRMELLRLRTYGGSTMLAHKKKPRNASGAFKVREETEVSVDSFDSIRRIPRLLGFSKSWVYEKKRQSWVLGSVEILVDQLPLIGNFIEIEGSEREIESAAKKLGFEMEDSISENYQSIYEDWRKKEGLKREDLVFAEGRHLS